MKMKRHLSTAITDLTKPVLVLLLRKALCQVLPLLRGGQLIRMAPATMRWPVLSRPVMP